MNEKDENPLNDWLPPPATRSPTLDTALLSAAMIVGILMAAGVSGLLAPQLGFELSETFFAELQKHPISLAQANALRLLQATGHFFQFCVPPLIFAHILYNRQAYRYLYADKLTSVGNFLGSISLLMWSLPLIQLAYTLNRAVPLPAFMRSMTDNADTLTKAFLEMPTVGILCANVFAMAILPAIGEELLFRGVVQRIFARATRSPQLGIWIAAAVFSAIHGQFEGFLPRLLLGAMLGYLVFWTGSLWSAIAAHAANNALQLVVAYGVQHKIIATDVDKIDAFPLIPTLISLVVTAVLVYYLHRNNEKNKMEYADRIKLNV